MPPDERSRTPHDVLVVDEAGRQLVPDELAVEEPLEIRVVTDAGSRVVAVTMRTPGADEALAAGFLYAEGVIEAVADVAGFAPVLDAAGSVRHNAVAVRLRPGLEPDLAPLERHFFTTSACGACGKAALDPVSVRGPGLHDRGPRLHPGLLVELPERLRREQAIFRATGGLHGAAWFDPEGRLLTAAEDVGRHNAVDKLVGERLLAGELPLGDGVLLVSGRAGWEIVQKAARAGATFVCAVSAPSSLAVALAQKAGMTLVGFLRGRRLNVYSGAQRLAPVGINRPGSRRASS